MIQLLAASGLLFALAGAADLGNEASGFPFAAATQDGDALRIEESRNGETIEVPADSYFVIALRSNPSTGADWEVAELPAGIHAIGSDYTADSQPQGVDDVPTVGGGGTTLLRFHAAEGSGKLRLAYRRGQPDAPASQTFEVEIVVR